MTVIDKESNYDIRSNLPSTHNNSNLFEESSFFQQEATSPQGPLPSRLARKISIAKKIKQRKLREKHQNRKRPLPFFAKEMDREWKSRSREELNPMLASEIMAIRRIKKEESERPLVLNILVVGKQGVGKTSFINMFLKYVNKKF